MKKEQYIAAYLAEFGKGLDVGVRNARQCAEAAYADDPEGDPVEAAQAEADEWKRAS